MTEQPRPLPELLAAHRARCQRMAKNDPMFVSPEVMEAYIAAVEAIGKVDHFNVVDMQFMDYGHDDDCPLCAAEATLTEVLTRKFGGREPVIPNFNFPFPEPPWPDDQQEPRP